MVTVLISVFVLGLLVVVHEFGHFYVARRSGVRVTRFSIGFGPKLFAWTRGHTEYVISAIPLGGYVKMAGELRAEQSNEPWEYLAKPVSTRAKIIFAGPFVNYLVAVVSLWLVFVIGYPTLLPVIGKVVEGMPAQAAGMLPGDRVRAVDGRPIETWEEMTKVIYRSPNRPVALQIERQGAVQTLTITPKLKSIVDPFGRSKQIGQIGVSASGAVTSRRLGPLRAIGETFHEHNERIAQTFLSLGALLTGKVSMRESVTGPIGIVLLTSEAARLGLGPLLSLVSFLSLTLAIFNLFPIPILDGGNLFFLILEKLRGKPVSLNIQERSAQVSFVALLALILVVCVNDVSRFGLVEKFVGWVKR